MILSITGHRLGPRLGGYSPNPLGRAIQRELLEQILELAPTKLISGMALGVDQWAAHIALRLGIPFVAAVPFIGHETRWRFNAEPYRIAYRELLAKAAKVEVVTKRPDGLTMSNADVAKAMQRRNEWMVDNSDVLLAVWDGSSSGTGNCVRYAEKVGRRVVRINPRHLSVGRVG